MKISSIEKIPWVVLLMATLMVLNDAVNLENSFAGPYSCANIKECGQPLYLTMFLNKSNVFEAQSAAKVHFPNSPEFERVSHVQSYSGFLTVNESLGSNIFFWFFLAETKPKESPLLLWLEGGPGGASTSDVFLSSCGPLQIGNDSKLTPGNNRWTKVMNVLYLDSPVGAGFSFTHNSSGYARNEKDYTKDLYAALTQFFTVFPDHLANDFFIGGISYAGKYVPSLAYEIHKKNPVSHIKMNLKGIAIGNGWIDPLIQIRYSKFLHGIGVIDLETTARFEKVENEIMALILNKEYIAASKKLFLEYLFSPNGTGSIMSNVTGISMYNYLMSHADDENSIQILIDKFGKMIPNPELRKSIHVGNQEFWLVYSKYETDYLAADEVQSIASKLTDLMDNYRVILYAGQLDVICNYPFMIEYVKKLKWKGADEYSNATRHQWLVGGELAGYSKTSGNFTEILVRNAGHDVHEDKPSWAFDILKRMSHNIPFY